MNNTSYQAGTQSLEQTVRNNNPEKTDAWVENEVERIEGDKTSQDSFSMAMGNQTAWNFNNNRDEDGNPLDANGNVVNDDEE